MLEQLIEIDKQLLLLGNSFHTPFLDNFVIIFSGKIIWLPAALAILYIIIRTQQRDAWWTVLFLAVAIVLADQISSGLIKPLVARWRPTHEPTLQGMVQIVHNYCGGNYGFVSSHAANACAVALFTSLVVRRKLYTWAISIWAIIDMYTRIYLGVHYPGDIVCGAIVGVLSALGAYHLEKRIAPHALQHTNEVQTDRCVNIFLLVVTITIGVIAIFNSYWPILAH